MSQASAYKLLNEVVAYWQGLPHHQLIELSGNTISENKQGDDDNQYLIESYLFHVKDENEIVEIDVMVAAAGTGPLHRLDRKIIVELNAKN